MGEKILNGKEVHLTPSQNEYDWLGEGIYFWENNPTRALDFAKYVKKYDDPFVIGAILSLGHCLDLMDHSNLQLIHMSHSNLEKEFNDAGKKLPKNMVSRTKSNKDKDPGRDKIFRYLDCAVIQNLHRINEKVNRGARFQSVRGLFTEGNPIYEGAGFNQKNHIQLCIRESSCIKGYFRPIEDL